MSVQWRLTTGDTQGTFPAIPMPNQEQNKQKKESNKTHRQSARKRNQGPTQTNQPKNKRKPNQTNWSLKNQSTSPYWQNSNPRQATYRGKSLETTQSCTVHAIWVKRTVQEFTNQGDKGRPTNRLKIPAPKQLSYQEEKGQCSNQ